MEKTNNNIPSAEELTIYIKEATVSVTNTYEQSPVVLMVDDSIVGTLGNFSASIGKAKSKKTFNVSAIAASALANSTDSITVHRSRKINGRYCISTPNKESLIVKRCYNAFYVWQDYQRMPIQTI